VKHINFSEIKHKSTQVIIQSLSFYACTARRTDISWKIDLVMTIIPLSS